MRVSELIKKLQAILDEYGDLPVHRFHSEYGYCTTAHFDSIYAAVTDEGRSMRTELEDAPVDTPPDTVII
jgi:hypothetical protein